MKTDWLIIEAEKIRETEKAVQFNLDQSITGTLPMLIWVPKSCLKETTSGGFSFTLIKGWIVRKNLWSNYRPKCFSQLPSTIERGNL